MPEQQFFPIISSRLTETFPELRQFILSHYDKNHTVKKGAEIIMPGERILYYLTQGKIKAYMNDEEGHQQLMYIYIKDTLIFSPFSDEFCKKLVALETATIYEINLSSIYGFLQTSPDYIHAYLKLISSRYGILMRQILTDNHQNAKHKIYHFLLSLAGQYGQKQADGSLFVNKFPTLTDLASLTNVHRSNVTAYINELETAGIITRQKRQLVINDLNALQQLSDETSS